MSTTYLGIIPKDLACGPFWPQIAGMLAQSLPYGRGEYTLDDLRDGIAAGDLFAIGAVTDGVVEFVATCSTIEFPRKRVLYVTYGAGRGGARLLEALKEAGRILGCDWIEQRSRASVAKLYERLGFSTDYRVAILELNT